jgi:hypothetical protein
LLLYTISLVLGGSTNTSSAPTECEPSAFWTGPTLMPQASLQRNATFRTGPAGGDAEPPTPASAICLVLCSVNVTVTSFFAGHCTGAEASLAAYVRQRALAHGAHYPLWPTAARARAGRLQGLHARDGGTPLPPALHLCLLATTTPGVHASRCCLLFVVIVRDSLMSRCLLAAACACFAAQRVGRFDGFVTFVV